MLRTIFKSYQQRSNSRNKILSREFTHRYPILYRSWLDGVHPSVAKYLNRPGEVPSPLIEIAERVYTCTLFQEEWRIALQEELQHFEEWSLEHSKLPEPPNSMHQYGIELAHLQFEDCCRELMEKVLSPLVRDLYPGVGSDKLDRIHAFTAQYGKGGDSDLGFHVDASDVTCNLCLGDTWVGGELYFQGIRCALHRQEPHHEDEYFVYDHTPGTLLIHMGKHRHGVMPIYDGFRRNIIMWCSAGEYQEEEIYDAQEAFDDLFV